jgi:hypothetical protein
MQNPMGITHRPVLRYAAIAESDQPLDITRKAPVM